MKLKLKKDIVIPKDTIFSKMDSSTTHFFYANYDFMIALDKDTTARLMAGAEKKEYFEVIK